ncbi:LPS export ABC transporter periplasmic protein LptC [Sphingomonas morindae]|uniref:LPS export ABC transporter periplasmic protein LptC n=1 Tax=Sphingomonas morindae TaxID=1541170 RepID=A0ABY4XBN5_9SPHN|nr:LPS export ABC transporter periplasmic protein LptC [Sphingomonas morindae]USI74166.1 LPS export ABC transporter periplasmic protein LptC [Sphingomonas morindae]
MPEAAAGPLSAAAREGRARRRRWAVPGSGHDRLIAVARVVLPALALVLVLVLALTPVTTGHEISFVLSKNRVATAPERMRVTRALYRGEDDSGQPFALSAASAVQARSADPVVQLKTLRARIGLAGGPATLTAPTGAYNMDNQKVALNGAVQFRSQDGYHIDTHDVDLDMKTRALSSRTPVTGRMPLGTFSADRMQADLDARSVVLTGNARLHIDQGHGKAQP